MDGHRGHVCALDPSDGLGRRVGPRLEILLVGVLRDTVQVLEVLGALVSRDQVRPLVVQDALRHAAEHALRIWTREGEVKAGRWTRMREEPAVLQELPVVCSGVAN